MSNIASGRQIRAARILAGLTQAELAQEIGFHPRAVRYWEAKGDALPTCVDKTLSRIEDELRRRGVIVFMSPSPGARIVISVGIIVAVRQI